MAASCQLTRSSKTPLAAACQTPFRADGGAPCLLSSRNFRFPEDFSFALSENMLYVRPSRLNERGVARDRHDTRGGDAVAARDRSVFSRGRGRTIACGREVAAS